MVCLEMCNFLKIQEPFKMYLILIKKDLCNQSYDLPRNCLRQKYWINFQNSRADDLGNASALLFFLHGADIHCESTGLVQSYLDKNIRTTRTLVASFDREYFNVITWITYGQCLQVFLNRKGFQEILPVMCMYVYI